LIYSLNTPIQDIKRIQPAYQKRLLKLGIKTIENLYYHFPHRYDDFSKIIPVGELKLNEVATIQGQVTEIKNIRTWRKKMFLTEAFIEDQSGAIKVVWFNQPFLAETLKKGSFVSLSGKVHPVRDFIKFPQRKKEESKISNGVNFDKTLYLSNPAYERISQMANSKSEAAISDKRSATSQLRHTGRLVPVYSETAGLSSRYLRYLIQIFSPALAQIKDWLPEETKKEQGLSELSTAIRQIHFPSSDKAIAQAKKRLAFDELFLIQLFVLQQKIKWQKENSLKIEFNESLIKKFVGQLPFKLTDAQRRAAWEILQDLQKTRPMNRLLEGDVGSGKTVVAVMAALQAMAEDWQVALMAPTEILAQQHWQNISALLKNYQFPIGLLTSSASKESLTKTATLKKKELVEKIARGEINFVIGTHALIQENVKFKKLALVIFDEQHRFGVEQRAALQKNILEIQDGLKSTIPHLLSMTATPIPRTLALTIYGDLDISLIDELPSSRQIISTQIVPPLRRQKTYEFIESEIKKGRQAFVICPRIEPDETLKNIDTGFAAAELKAVKEEYEKLSKKIFPDFKIGMLHGRLKSKEKEQIMFDFKNGKIDVLVSTSVVEVGIDVPNATVMMIEGAERFGLAQLHQFRGRVGRGQHQSYCFLFTESSAAKAHARLKALVGAKSGFELAEKDLAIRGPGEFFGTRQSGLPDLSMASLADIDLIKQVRVEAIKILQKDPVLKNYPLLGEKLKKFQKTIHLE